MTQEEKEREQRIKKKNEQMLQKLSDSIRKVNTSIIDIQKGEGQKNGTENPFKQMKTFSNTLKQLKVNDQNNSQGSQEKIKTVRYNHYIFIRYFSRNLQVRRQCNEIFKILKENSPAKISISKKLSFRYEGEIMAFPDKQKIREFTTARPAIQEMLKGALLTKTKMIKLYKTE